jgi:RAB protein geranylgeranyltransferase component A
VFGGATLDIPEPCDESTAQLSFSRAYSLALAPQLIYTDSRLLKVLVASKVYRQLDFLAMGSWWIFSKTEHSSETEPDSSQGRLIRVPTSREDVAFADSSIDLRSKRLVMKVLRFVMDYENQTEVWEPFVGQPFADFLVTKFKLPPLLVNLFLGLSLSTGSPSDTATGFALSRVARHLRSIGRLGEGFSAVILKWGGLSELVQVSCRAGAVGGAVYMLGTGITSLEHASDEAEDKKKEGFALRLSNDDKVTTKVLVSDDSNSSTRISTDTPLTSSRLSRSISIVSSPLSSVYTPPSEGSPSPAGSVVVLPPNSIDGNSNPIYLFIHSSDTGECPSGQCKSSEFPNPYPAL